MRDCLPSDNSVICHRLTDGQRRQRQGKREAGNHTGGKGCF